jgi:NAD(P)H-dependent FMN reductase
LINGELAVVIVNKTPWFGKPYFTSFRPTAPDGGLRTGRLRIYAKATSAFMSPLIQVIIGTTRPDRFSEKPAAWVVDRLHQRDDLDVEVVDLRDHPLPMYASPVAPARAGRDYPNDDVARLGTTLDRADGYVIVTGEYNHGYPAVLKNALDHVFPELNRKPVTFVGYGNVGGARAIEQLRLVAVEFEMAPLRWAVHIHPDVMLPAMRTDPFSIELFASLDPRLETAVNDLVWWSDTLKAGRAAGS